MTTKVRQGRKACTLVSGFEPYNLSAEYLAEELRKICASSTSGVYCAIDVGRKDAHAPGLV